MIDIEDISIISETNVQKAVTDMMYELKELAASKNQDFTKLNIQQKTSTDEKYYSLKDEDEDIDVNVDVDADMNFKEFDHNTDDINMMKEIYDIIDSVEDIDIDDINKTTTHTDLQQPDDINSFDLLEITNDVVEPTTYFQQLTNLFIGSKKICNSVVASVLVLPNFQPTIPRTISTSSLMMSHVIEHNYLKDSINAADTIAKKITGVISHVYVDNIKSRESISDTSTSVSTPTEYIPIEDHLEEYDDYSRHQSEWKYKEIMKLNESNDKYSIMKRILFMYYCSSSNNITELASKYTFMFSVFQFYRIYITIKGFFKLLNQSDACLLFIEYFCTHNDKILLQLQNIIKGKTCSSYNVQLYVKIKYGRFFGDFIKIEK